MLLSTVVGSTGAELMLYDNPPFLVELSTPSWTQVLTLFKRLVCYSNTRYDVSVHYSTAAIRAPGTVFIPPQKHLIYPAILNDSSQEPIPTDDSYESLILKNLLKLDWKRYAVIPSRPFLAHIDVIIKSVWLNHKHGISIVCHIIDHFRIPSVTTNVHLIVIVCDGDTRDVLRLREFVRNKFARPSFKVVSVSKIEEKLVTWLKYQILHSNATKLSFIGHGNGGLLARWVGGMLRVENVNVEMVNLVCIDTPHLSTGLPQTTLWKNKDIIENGDDTRMADLINTEEFVGYAQGFKNLVLYASSKDPSLSIHSGLLLDSPDPIAGLQNRQAESIIAIDNPGSLEGISSLDWKRFAIVPSKITKLCLYWNDVEHPVLEHLSNQLFGKYSFA
jgi:Putative serine esterase (DUF676)